MIDFETYFKTLDLKKKNQMDYNVPHTQAIFFEPQNLTSWGFQISNEIEYRISSYSFCGNYSFFNLEIQRSQYINMRRLFKRGNYSRAETTNYMRK